MDPAQVELKITIDGADAAQRVRHDLGLRRRDAQQATIWFCDHVRRTAGRPAQFQLADRGVIVRLRKRGDESDTTIKFRRSAPLVLPAGWPPQPPDGEFKVEGDWTATRRTTAASLTATVPGVEVDAVAGGRLGTGLFSAGQRRFAAALLAPQQVGLTTLRPLGPIQAWRWQETERDDLGNELGAEHWDAGGLEFLELSIRVKAANAETWLKRFGAWAIDHELPRSTGATKTQTVLEHFAARAAV